MSINPYQCLRMRRSEKGPSLATSAQDIGFGKLTEAHSLACKIFFGEYGYLPLKAVIISKPVYRET